MLEAIATPRRREILHLVWDTELTAGQIAANFDVSWPAISQNLRVLREAGVVTERRDGNRRLYRANESALGSLTSVLRQMWAIDVDSLKRAVEKDSGSGADG